MGACTSREDYVKGSDKIEPPSQPTLEEQRKKMQESFRRATINQFDRDRIFLEKSERMAKRAKVGLKDTADKEHNFEIDPRDNQILDDLLLYIINPPITSAHFKKVFLEIIVQIQGDALKEYVFESLVGLFRHALCDEHQQRDNIEFSITVPPFLKSEWIVLKVEKTKSLSAEKFRACVKGIQQCDTLKDIKNIAGNAAKVAKKALPIVGALFKFVSVNPEALNGAANLADTDIGRFSRKMNVGFNNVSTKLSPVFDLLNYVSQKHRIVGEKLDILSKQFYDMYPEVDGCIRFNDYVHCFQLLQKLILGEKLNKEVVFATVKERSLENPDSRVPYIRFEKYFTVDVAAI